MERSELFDLMGELQLYGMKAAFDEIMATAVKRRLSLRPAANSCSISSAGSTSAPRSSSPPISPSANGRPSSPTPR